MLSLVSRVRGHLRCDDARRLSRKMKTLLRGAFRQRVLPHHIPRLRTFYRLTDATRRLPGVVEAQRDRTSRRSTMTQSRTCATIPPRDFETRGRARKYLRRTWRGPLAACYDPRAATWHDVIDHVRAPYAAIPGPRARGPLIIGGEVYERCRTKSGHPPPKVSENDGQTEGSSGGGL